VVVGGGDDGERRGRTVPVGGENGVGEEKGGNERVFGGSNSGERRSRHRFWSEITAPVPVEGERGWGGGRENGFLGENFWRETGK
jgi:hypothetical protein